MTVLSVINLLYVTGNQIHDKIKVKVFSCGHAEWQIVMFIINNNIV